MNKDTTGILRDDITLQEWVAFLGDANSGDDYLRKVVSNAGKRLEIGFIHLPESFYKSVTTEYPAAELQTMLEDGEIGVSTEKVAVLIGFDKAKAAPFRVRWLATGAVDWVKDFNPKGVSEKGLSEKGLEGGA